MKLHRRCRKKLTDFYGNYASEEETAEAIRNLYEKQDIS